MKTSVDLSKGIVVCPFLSFYFSFSLFHKTEGSPHSYMHDDDLYGVQGIEDEVLVWISQRNCSMPPSLFLFFIFLFFSFFIFLMALMALSI